MNTEGYGCSKGFQMMKRGDYEQAAEFFKTVLETGDPRAHYGLAEVLMGKDVNVTEKEVREAIDHYNITTATDEFPEALYRGAVARGMLTHHLMNAYKTHPDDPRVREEIEETLEVAQGDLTRAGKLAQNDPHLQKKIEAEKTRCAIRMNGMDYMKAYFAELHTRYTRN